LVVYLCSKDNSESGQVFEAGASWYGQIKQYRSKGVVIKNASVESVREHWKEITDQNDAIAHDSSSEVTAALLQALDEAKSKL